MYCLTLIPYFVGICKEKTFLVLFDHLEILQICRDQDTTCKEYLFEICSNMKHSTWVMTESKNLSKCIKDDIQDKVDAFKQIFENCEIKLRKRESKGTIK